MDEKKHELTSDVEKCILCGKNTKILVGLRIQERKNYVPGCGQLCETCYEKLKAERNK